MTKVSVMSASMCRICLEPIYNFICPECINGQMRTWIKDNAAFLMFELQRTHKMLLRTFPQTKENVLHCMKCKKTSKHVFCPYCYSREAYLSLRSFDPLTAEKMIQVFNFDLENTGYHKKLEIPAALDEEVERSDLGICEGCGGFSEFLKAADSGHFVCEFCRLME